MKGFNQVEFAQYIDSKKENGTDIDNWTFDDLQAVVYEFQAYYGAPIYQEPPVAAEPIHDPNAYTDYQNPDQPIESPESQPAGVSQQEEKKEGGEQPEQQQIHSRLRSKTPKQHLKTKRCEEQQTELNFKRVDIEVSESEVKEGGIFSASYPIYKVSTTFAGKLLEVRRKDADFLFLRKHLLRGFPHLIIPPCPNHQPKLMADKIKKREKYYTRFLQAIVRCEELKTSRFLFTFLSEQDVKLFQKVQKDAERLKDQIKNRPFEELVTFSGAAKVIVQPGSGSERFNKMLNETTENYQTLYREAINCAKTLHEQAMGFSASFHSMKRLMDQMAEQQKRINCHSQVQVFENISKVMSSTGVFVKNLGEVMNKGFAEHLKYNLHEADTFRDLFSHRENLAQQQAKLERALQDKKEKLLKLRDPTKWGASREDLAEMIRMREDLFKDRELAFDYMLPKETQDIEQKRYELNFFSNQCWDEIRRVSKDNGMLLTEHFKDYAMLHCTQISSNASSWEELLNFLLTACEKERENEKKLIEGGVQPVQVMMQQMMRQEDALVAGDGGSGASRENA
ncbi:hypothetical protein FGO68_gene7261 [Halteria grandinella]|uniref:PX domain-containing protein n=1 Tax=Halteria grandinella TaxID=5974 RepID=A0A8J8NE68_HALGN|nr:hypothetical protein FGO68_gene7261 [Halteria grandinella]